MRNGHGTRRAAIIRASILVSSIALLSIRGAFAATAPTEPVRLVTQTAWTVDGQAFLRIGVESHAAPGAGSITNGTVTINAPANVSFSPLPDAFAAQAVSASAPRSGLTIPAASTVFAYSLLEVPVEPVTLTIAFSGTAPNGAPVAVTKTLRIHRTAGHRGALLRFSNDAANVTGGAAPLRRSAVNYDGGNP